MKGFLVFVMVGLTVTFCNAVPDCSKFETGVSLPDVTDCNGFFVCDNKVAVEKKCPFDFHFSPTDLYCQPRYEAGCDNSGTRPPPTTDHPPGPSNNLCKNQELGKRIPYPEVCTKFITCIGGGVTENCPSNLHFNADLEVCDWPESAKCQWRN